MKKIGLTGGIGSGKSYVADVFRHLGVPVFNSDDVARELQQTEETVRSAIAQEFGDVFLASGELDRKKVAQIVFSDRSKLEKLNAIVHPAVGKAFEEFCSKHADAPYIIKEAAIIFEVGINEHLDGTILISAPEKIRIERVMKRDNVSESDVRARIGKQWSDQQKSELADWTIVNDNERAILPQVLKIHTELIH